MAFLNFRNLLKDSSLFDLIRSWIYTDDIIILFEHKIQTHQVSPATVVCAEEGNLCDLLVFDTARVIRHFREFLKKGDQGYLAYLDGTCVFRMCIKHGSQIVRLHRFLSMRLQKNEAFIDFMKTAPRARGKNICPHALSTAVEDLGKEFRIYLAVLGSNEASIKAVTKSGFQPKAKLRLVVSFGVPLMKPDGFIFLGFLRTLQIVRINLVKNHVLHEES